MVSSLFLELLHHDVHCHAQCSKEFIAYIKFRTCTWPINSHQVKYIVSLWHWNPYQNNFDSYGDDPRKQISILIQIEHSNNIIPGLETSTHEKVGSWYHMVIIHWHIYSRNNIVHLWNNNKIYRSFSYIIFLVFSNNSKEIMLTSIH